MAEKQVVDESHFSKFDLGSMFIRSSDFLVDGDFKSFRMVVKEFHPAGTIMGGDKKRVDKPCLSFTNSSKLMILSATNQEVLHLVTGQSDGFKTVGYTITLSARAVEAFGEPVLGVRIMPEKSTLIRKGLKKFLGREAIWTGQKPPNKDEKNDKGQSVSGTGENTQGSTGASSS